MSLYQVREDLLTEVTNAMKSGLLEDAINTLRSAENSTELSDVICPQVSITYGEISVALAVLLFYKIPIRERKKIGKLLNLNDDGMAKVARARASRV